MGLFVWQRVPKNNWLLIMLDHQFSAWKSILDIPPISTNPDGFLGHVGSMEFCCFSICRCLMASHTGLLVVPTCSKDPQGIRLRGVNIFSRNIFNVGSQNIQYQKPPARSMCVESTVCSCPCPKIFCKFHVSAVPVSYISLQFSVQDSCKHLQSIRSWAFSACELWRWSAKLLTTWRWLKVP